MKLRAYQQEAVDALWSYFCRFDGNPMIAMPTGTGKSVVIAAFIQQALARYPNTRVMMLTHVKKLIQQNFGKLLEAWPTAPGGIYSAGLKRRDVHYPITFAGIQSIAKLADEFEPPDLIIIDEAHLVSPKQETQYRKFLASMQARNPRMRVVGLSATCYRLGLGSLVHGGIFTTTCYDITGIEAFNYLIKQGFLAPLHAVRTNYQLDVGGVALSGGDYVQAQLQRAVDKESVTAAALAELCRAGMERRRWLVFASGVQHANHIARALCDTGIQAAAIHSANDSDENEALYNDFARGRLRCAVSMNALTTGIDVPEIDLIAMLRPTKSASLWVQMLGRGTRPAPWAGKQDCLVLDFTSNTQELGPINDPVIPHPRGSKRNGATQAAPVRLCPLCASYNAARATHCVYCGHEFAAPVNINVNSSGLEVLRLDDPVVEEIPVRSVNYARVAPRNKPAALLVTYFCAGKEGGDIPRRFTQYVCLEHVGAARRYAERWWRENCMRDIDAPDNVQRAIDLAKSLRIPKALRVWVNKTRPEIMSYVYDTN